MYSRISTRQYRRTLSDRESKVLSSLSYAGKTVFTIKDLKALALKPKNILDNLVKKKWVLKIRKGVYTIVPFEAGEQGAASYTVHSFVIASVLVKPYYIGYRSALNHHGLTDQTPPSIYVATTKPTNSRRILDSEFKFVTIPSSKMFGVTETEVEKRKIRISSKEKTIVDCLDHPEHAGGVEEVAKALYFFKDEIDLTKVAIYAEKIGNGTVVKRLGYLADTLKLLALSKLLSRRKLASGYSLLDPTLPRHGRILEKWKLILNVHIDSAKWIK